MKKAIGVILLILILMASAFATTPVIAKNLNLPKGADAVLYYTGGEAIFNLPTDPALRINYPTSATMMKLHLMYIEIPNVGLEFSSMLIYLYMIPLSGGTTRSWQFFAHITTNLQNAISAKDLWSGTLAEFPGPHYVPTWVTTDNVKYVSDPGVFQVWRHGNNIYANLAAPLSIQRPTGVSFNIPAFSIELNNYGGSFHSSTSSVLTGWYDASEYTVTEDMMNFNANGAFISAWNTNGIPISIPVSDGEVIMQGILTFYPPAT